MLDEPKIASVLAELHERSDRQLRLLRPLSIARRLGGWVGLSIDLNKPAMRALLGDKLVALDPDKARLCYLLCRTIGARHVVEVGTSFGVSTIYLAAAVRETGGNGMVIGTEQEPAVRRQNIWRNSRRRLTEHRPRLGVDVRRRACGAASADVRWSGV